MKGTTFHSRSCLMVLCTFIALQNSGCFSSSGANSAAFSKLPDPSISLDSIPNILRGDFEYQLSFQAQVDSRLSINSILIELSQDGGSSYSTVATLSGNASLFTWRTPSIDASNLKLRVSAFDSRNNRTSAESGTFEIITTPPQFASNQPVQALNRDRSFPLDGKCSPRWPIHISTTMTDETGKILSGATQTLNCNSDGTWSIPGGLQTDIDGTLSYNIDQTDAVGHVSQLGGTWTNDTTPPSQIKLAAVQTDGDRSISGSGQTYSSSTNFIPLSLQASDPIAGVKDFCLKYSTLETPTQPTDTDSCWVMINRADIAKADGSSANQLLISKYIQRIGFSAGTFKIFVWLRDQLGNVSNVSDSNGSTITVNYNPKLPPQIANLTANLNPNTTSTSDPSARPDPSLYTTTQGPVYIRWQTIENDKTNPIDASGLNLYYTTDGSTYSRVPGGQGLSKNYVAGGCSIDSQYYSGCFIWSGSLPTGYFKVRLSVQDVNGQVSAASTNPINSGAFQILAGNTDPGAGDLSGEVNLNWGTSGSASMFFNDLTRSDTSDSGSLVVLDDGTIFFKDKNRGILTVNPRDGIQRVLLRLPRSTDTSPLRGDGGLVSDAWVKSPVKIALDWSAEGGLLIFDYDRIRRVNLKTLQIDTLIGSATPAATEPDDSSSPIAATDVVFLPTDKSNLTAAGKSPLLALPNGDIYFQTENFNGVSGRLRVYHQGQVTSIRPVGNGPSQYKITSGATTNWDYSGPIDQPISGGDPLVTDHTYHTSAFRTAFGFDAKGNTVIQNLQVGIMHLHPGNAHILFTELGLDWSLLGKKSLQASMNPSGILPTGMYDDLTFAHTGRDGRLYVFNRSASKIFRYEPATSSSGPSWKLIAGLGGSGYCEDNTIATQCSIDVQDVFVTSSGDLYFADRGRIRTIADDGTVVTLVGQGYSYGDGKLASSARFNQIGTIDQVNQNGTVEIVTFDPQEARIRSFKIGDVVQTIAGNGKNGNYNGNLLVSDPTQSLNVTGWGLYFDTFVTNPANGDIYLSGSNGTTRIVRINRSTNPNHWESIVGGGSNYYDVADGFTGNQINLAQPSSYGTIANYFPSILGFQNNQILTAHHVFSYSLNIQGKGFHKIYDLSQSNKQINLAGSSTLPVSSYCAVGTPLNTSSSNPNGCTIPNSVASATTRASYLPAYGSNPAAWLLASRNSRQILNLAVGGNMSVFTTTLKPIYSFVYREIPATSTTAAQSAIYYCGNDGNLYYKTKPVTSTTWSTETNLPFPVSSISCTGRSMLYHSGRNSLIFPVQQTGMSAIGEFLLN